MHDLQTLEGLNKQRCKAASREDFATRHCSYASNEGAGCVILHSALNRSTGFLGGDVARRFLAAWEAIVATDLVARDLLVESYFHFLPDSKKVDL